MAHKMKSDNGMPRDMSREGIQEMKEELEEDENDEEEDTEWVKDVNQIHGWPTT